MESTGKILDQFRTQGPHQFMLLLGALLVLGIVYFIVARVEQQRSS